MGTRASDVSICHYRLSRGEYDRAVEAGAFEPDAKLELIDGNLHAMTPEGSRHAAVMDIVAHHLPRVFGSEFYIRIQHPLAVDDYSEPEPDIAVVRGAAHDYLDAHPTAAVLIVEILTRRPLSAYSLNRRTRQKNGKNRKERQVVDWTLPEPHLYRKPLRGY